MRFLILALAMALGGCVLHVSEKNIVHPQPGAPLASGTSQDGAWTIEALSVPVDSTVTLRGAIFRKPNSTATVLYFGGNGFVLSKHYQYVLGIYKNLPVDFVAFDYRGYGGSSGVATLDGMMKDGLAIYDHVKTMPELASKPLIVHGQSMGSFVAGHVASQRTLDGLVLESSATTAEDWVGGFAKRTILIRKAVVDSSLKGKGNSAVMATLNEPVLIVVGKDDDTTRPEMSQALFEQAAVPDDWKELLVVPHAGHINAALGAGYGTSFLRLLSHASHTAHN